MDDSFNIVSPSPDARHTARLVVSGEIRYGPLYYALSVDAYSFGQRIFGAAHLWSSSSQLLAVQEWLTLDYSEGPITALTLIDLAQGRETTVARVTKAFVVPETFEHAIVTYRIDAGGQEGVEHLTADARQIVEWTALARGE
jgi:hypothetical protein